MTFLKFYIESQSTDKMLFTRIMILNKYFVTGARLLVLVIEMILLKSFSVLLVKTECMVASKRQPHRIKASKMAAT